MELMRDQSGAYLKNIEDYTDHQSMCTKPSQGQGNTLNILSSFKIATQALVFTTDAGHERYTNAQVLHHSPKLYSLQSIEPASVALQSNPDQDSLGPEVSGARVSIVVILQCPRLSSIL